MLIMNDLSEHGVGDTHLLCKPVRPPHPVWYVLAAPAAPVHMKKNHIKGLKFRRLMREKIQKKILPVRS